MPKRSLKYYTLRYLIIAILGIIAIWAASFYWLIIDEVYDNIDDGLKDSELRIKNELNKNPEVLLTSRFDLAQFRITSLAPGNYNYTTYIYNTKMYMPYDDDDEPVRILQNIFSHQGKPYQLEIYTSTVEEDELLENLLIALLVLYFALVISLVLINHFILKKAWSPFYNLLNKLKAYKIGKGNQFEITKNNIKEFNELENELSAMISRNEQIYEQQNQFIGNASHELQTPLAIASNKLELLMEDESVSENQIQKIDEVNQTLNRLKRLNKSLLMLSRIENRQFQPTENLVINDVVHQSLEEFEPMIEFKKIQVNLTEKGYFEAKMNPDLAAVLINNLIKNAITHSKKDKELTIEISNKFIWMKNAGEETLDPQKIFARFYKDQQNENSTGLGLAITKSIINLYPELTIQYRFDQGHIFEIKKF